MYSLLAPILIVVVRLTTASSITPSTLASISEDVNRLPNTFLSDPTLPWSERFSSTLLSNHPIPKTNATYTTVEVLSSIPDNYDLRDDHSSCASPNKIFDQGSCGGCWALSVAGSLSDRFCLSGGYDELILSPQDLLDCVGGSSKGCNGGFTEDGFDYVSDEGIRTLDDVPFEAEDGFCETSDDKKYFTQSWAQYVSSDEERIMSEVLINGSVSAVFEVFADFFTYAGGVYSHVTGDYAGLHAVVLTGWGESEEEGKWWIVRNSWGEDFGEGGYFRIKRGLDENGCNFEGGLTTAMIKG